jgi:hypothetical protein
MALTYLERRKLAFPSGGKETELAHFTGNKTSIPNQGKKSFLTSLTLSPAVQAIGEREGLLEIGIRT